MDDESAIPIIVFMRQSQNSIIVHWRKAVKAIPGARSFRYRTLFGRIKAASGYLRDRVFIEMPEISVKRCNAGAHPVGKSHRGIARRPRVFRTKLGVLMWFAVGIALALSVATPVGFAQQAEGAGAKSNGAQAAGPDAAAVAGCSATDSESQTCRISRGSKAAGAENGARASPNRSGPRRKQA